MKHVVIVGKGLTLIEHHLLGTGHRERCFVNRMQFSLPNKGVE